MAWLQKRDQRRVTDLRVPLARSEDLIVDEVDGQVVVYDERTHQAHCLSPTAGQVWHACDGQTPQRQLTAKLQLDADTVERALDELEACGLLDGITSTGVTRREVTARFAKVGVAAAATAPLIYSIVAPTPAAAVSLTVLCQAVNTVAGHDCGSQTPGPPLGCHSIAGCCCCHNFTLPPLTTICAGDPEHCCSSPAGCTAAGGHPCS